MTNPKIEAVACPRCGDTDPLATQIQRDSWRGFDFAVMTCRCGYGEAAPRDYWDENQPGVQRRFYGVAQSAIDALSAELKKLRVEGSVPLGYRMQPISEFDAYRDVLRQINELECELARLHAHDAAMQESFIQANARAERAEAELERFRAAVHGPDGWAMENRALQHRAERAEAEVAGLRALIEGAATGEAVEVGDDESGQPRVLIHSTRDELAKGEALVFRRVCILPIDKALAGEA